MDGSTIGIDDAHLRVAHQVIEKYKHLLFQVDHDNVFVSLCPYLDYEQETPPFSIMEDDVKETITDWPENLCESPTQMDSKHRKPLRHDK